MSNRTDTFRSYNFLVSLEGQILGGFTEMSKIQGTHKVNDVTLKRGLVVATSLSEWINSARSSPASAGKQLTITLRNEANQLTEVYKLSHAIPTKYTGPTLSGKGTDVAIEELVLVCENISIETPPR